MTVHVRDRDGKAEPGSDALPSPGPSDHGPTVSAADVRVALSLTQYQLRELTAGLRLDVGERPNYPRYTREAIHRMVATQTLRELRIPLENALRVASERGPLILTRRGWLLLAPRGDDWSIGFAGTDMDLLLWLRSAGGQGSVVDLESLAVRVDKCWAACLAGKPAPGHRAQ